jgi:hypothetical protein
LTARLHPEDVEAIAARVVELLETADTPATSTPPSLVDAAAIAARFGVSRSWVYEHATELGAIRLGEPGERRRPRLRFNPDRVAEVLDAQSRNAGERPSPQPGTSSRPRRRAARADGPMLPIKGR